MAINLVTKVSPKVAERLYKTSVTEGLFSNEYDFVGAQAIQVHSVDTVELSAYDRTLTDGASGTIGKRFGKVTELGDDVNTYTMSQLVKYNLGVDITNDTDQNNIKKEAGKIISRQTREVVVPTVDKYRIGQLAAGAGIKKVSVSASALNKTNILETLMGYRAELRNNFSPEGQQVVFVGETDYVQMALANQVIGCDSIAEKPIVNGVLGKLAGMQIRTVPDSYMPSGLKILIVTKGSAWAPTKVNKTRVITDPEDYAGQLIQFLMYHDCFVNKVRENTILAAYSTAGPGA